MAAAERFGCEVLTAILFAISLLTTTSVEKVGERHLLGIAKMAKMISKHTDVLCSFITPYEDVREKILRFFPDDALMVHVSTSLEVCEERDVKGCMQRQEPEKLPISGIFDPFDEPKCAHITLNSTGGEGGSIDDMVEQLAHLFEKKKAVLLPSMATSPRWS